MTKVYCTICDKYRKFKNLKISNIFKKHQVFLLFAVNVAMNIKIFKEQESIEILRLLGLITDREEYQKIYNHDRRKHKSRIYIEKCR